MDWSTTDHLLANVIDVLVEANWQRAGDKKQPHPKPIPRPGEKKRMNPTEIRQRLLEQRQRKEAERGD